MGKVHVPFFTDPVEVDDTERAVLERQGLLLDEAPAAPEQAGTKTVTTIYGDRPELPADEAAALEAQGLTVKNRTEAKTAVAPAPAPEIPAAVKENAK